MKPNQPTKLVKNLQFYKDYHSNPVNVLIHLFFVPTILFSSFGICLNFSVKFGVLVEAVFIAVYFYLDSVLAVGISVIIAAGSSFLYSLHLSNRIYWSGFFLGWAVQFIGHYKFEGKSPAIFTSLFQSLVLAPLFVYVEVLMLLGYCQEIKKQLK